MTSKEESDSMGNGLNNSENQTTHNCNADEEPSVIDNNMGSQVEIGPTNMSHSSQSFQDDSDLPTKENSEIETETLQNDPPKEELVEDSLPIQIPIPRKLMMHMVRLFRIIYVSIPKLETEEKKALIDKPIFYSRKVQMKLSDKIPLQPSLPQQVPSISNDRIIRMLVHLLCGRHFFHTARHGKNKWVKQKFIARLTHPNILIHSERNKTFHRPLRVYYRPRAARTIYGKHSKLTNTNEKDVNHISVRRMRCSPWRLIKKGIIIKAFKINRRTYYKLRLVIMCTNNGCIYLCPICGCIFHYLIHFKNHSCRCPEN
uniref:CPX chromosomal region candidate gene 1 protein n=1 Tax=Jaculus jaculus TaxID=51337 RepID=UPI001E1B3392|nr:CPX chromosomal region candidate gene 1 protein [Jaculus jaculus]